MKEVINLIIDLAELCYKSQHKLNEELIEIPQYREWTDLLIDGISCVNVLIKKRKKQNIIPQVEKR